MTTCVKDISLDVAKIVAEFCPLDVPALMEDHYQQKRKALQHLLEIDEFQDEYDEMTQCPLPGDDCAVTEAIESQKLYCDAKAAHGALITVAGQEDDVIRRSFLNCETFKEKYEVALSKAMHALGRTYYSAMLEFRMALRQVLPVRPHQLSCVHCMQLLWKDENITCDCLVDLTDGDEENKIGWCGCGVFRCHCGGVSCAEGKSAHAGCANICEKCGTRNVKLYTCKECERERCGDCMWKKSYCERCGQ